MTAPFARDLAAARVLGLLDAPSFGPKRVLDVLSRWPDPQDAIEYLIADAKTSDKVVEHLRFLDQAVYLRQIEQTRALGGDFKLWNDDSYPSNLGRWAARPPVLFFKGDIDQLTTRALALVGRVDPTDQGIDAAGRFARLCVDNNIDVVSGLAKGIDGASHRAALMDPPGRTYAVVGHGLDFAYPAENRELYGAIPMHGAVISQFALGVSPQRWTFPARNEAMCTLALGTVIIEGKEGCGSIIQADFSFKHDRPVFILSRNLKTDNAEWAHKLVKRGAVVVEHFDQVTDAVERKMGELWGEKQVQGTFFNMDELVHSPSAEPKAALFDLDGVVVSTMTTERSAIAEVATRHLGRPVELNEVQAFGSPPEKLRALGVTNYYAVYRNEYQAAWLKHLGETTVFDEVVSVIVRLLDEGWRVGAITSQSSSRADRMIPQAVRELFSEFITYSEGGKDKSSAITRLLTKWNVAADRAFYIGDQPKDIEAARGAGVHEVAALWGFASEQDLRALAPEWVLEAPTDADQLLTIV
ncbi:HAD-IA family hydrolase [Herbiconiux liangxiaofengii]|uniref:HAD-IA family hydrolase n=1 Tax=Herbiconiux liangxiaofengii TaxID=3342795 RepID=UPI0035BAE8CC